MDEALVKSRVAGRQAANDLSDLYVTESARLSKEHGPEAAAAFLELLRDNLIAIRPFPEPKPEPVVEHHETRQRIAAGERYWDHRDIPDRYTLITFDDEVMHETDSAILIGELWVPKSQMFEVPAVGEYIEEWPVTAWFANKEGLI